MVRVIVPALIVAALVAVGVAGALERNDDRDAVWVGLAQDAQRGVDNSHLRLEELLAGERRLRLQNDVVNPLRMTEQICRALRDGGPMGSTTSKCSPATPRRGCAPRSSPARRGLRAGEARPRRAGRTGRSTPPTSGASRETIAAMHALDSAVKVAIRDGGRPPLIACAVAAALLLLALVAAIGAQRAARARRRRHAHEASTRSTNQPLDSRLRRGRGIPCTASAVAFSVGR